MRHRDPMLLVARQKLATKPAIHVKLQVKNL